MLLTKMRHNERGSALMAVIALMGITGVIALVVGTVTVNALVITDVTRTSVQSQAAAEAGLEATLASLRANGCSTGTVYASTDAAPYYSAEVAVSGTGTNSSDFHSGCPSATGYLRILSTGSDTAAGLIDPDARPHTVEGIYHTTVSSAGVTGTGPTIYTFSGAGVSGSGSLVAVNGSQPSVQIKHGNFDCSGAGTAEADIIVADGNFEASGSCETGNVWSSGTTKISGGSEITGNVVAAGLEFSGKTITGSAWSTAGMVLKWGSTVNGNATSNSMTLNGGKIGGDAWVSGAASFPKYASTIGGHLTAKSVSGDGVASTGNTVVPAGPGPGPTPTSAPVVSEWVDFTYTASDWPGFVEKVIAGSCDYSVLRNAVSSLGASSGIIDARGCTNGITIAGDDKLDMTSDLVILAKSFSLSGGGALKTTAPRKVWLITPDTTPDRLPTCPSGGGTTFSGGFKFDSQISAMSYTPCRATITSGITLTGQVYAGVTTIDGAATVKYVPIGLPLIDLDSGEPAGGSGVSTLGEPYSVRDYVGN
jgi:cytoskeletal protein CcmA (bactofilin family)